LVGEERRGHGMHPAAAAEAAHKKTEKYDEREARGTSRGRSLTQKHGEQEDGGQQHARDTTARAVQGDPAARPPTIGEVAVSEVH
jgi:hypothetical protein